MVEPAVCGSTTSLVFIKSGLRISKVGFPNKIKKIKRNFYVIF